MHALETLHRWATEPSPSSLLTERREGCVCVCVCTRARVCAHVHMCVRVHVSVCMCTRVHVCVYDTSASHYSRVPLLPCPPLSPVPPLLFPSPSVFLLLTSAMCLFLSWSFCWPLPFPSSLVSLSPYWICPVSPDAAGDPTSPGHQLKGGSYLKESKVLAAQISVPSMSRELSLLPF